MAGLIDTRVNKFGSPLNSASTTNGVLKPGTFNPNLGKTPNPLGMPVANAKTTPTSLSGPMTPIPPNTPQGNPSVWTGGAGGNYTDYPGIAQNNPPTQTDPNASTYSGGVNSSGQKLPGYTPQPLFPSVAQSLIQSSQTTPDIEAARKKVQDIMDQYGASSAQLSNAPGLGLQEASGQQGALNALYSQRLASAQQGLSSALQAQSQTQQGLEAAGGLVQPQLGAIGQVPFSPDTLQGGGVLGASGAGGNTALNPLNNIQSIAQQVISRQLSPEHAYAMGGSVQNFQGALNAEIQRQKPGFDTAQAQGEYNARQSNVTTSGTAPVNAAASLYQSTYPQLANLKTTVANVDQFGNLLLQSMKDSGGNIINPSDVKYANSTLSQIRNQLSSEQQAVFDNTFASLKSRVSGLLAMGGNEIPTQITADANKIIDGSLPFKSLAAVLQRISTEGNILVQNLEQQQNFAGGTIGAPKTGNNNNPLGI